MTNKLRPQTQGGTFQNSICQLTPDTGTLQSLSSLPSPNCWYSFTYSRAAPTWTRVFDALPKYALVERSVVDAFYHGFTAQLR